MKVVSTLSPGQNGTKQLVKKYGDQLIYIRYRYDPKKQKRYKTVELIVDEQEWIPNIRISADKVVSIRIGFGEAELREEIKLSGGFWDQKNKVWKLSFHKVRLLGIENRIIESELY